MRHRMLFGAAVALLQAMPPAASAAPLTRTPAIRIAVPDAGPWRVDYRLHAPARALAFARSPDASRAADWTVPAAFEIARDARGEIVRRRDGAAFTRVTLTVPPVYRDLPKDYAPFSPFGDGGVAFHSGRFFACADACPTSPRWRLTVRAPGRNVMVDGRARAGSADWGDDGEGRAVYVGTTRPTETAGLLAVIDGALPPAIRSQLDADLPRFLRFYAARTAPLARRPMLLVSYDLGHPSGWGRQGGTLPGQVFVHFYGARWAAEMTKPGFATDLAWHLAHEAAHLHQRQITLAGADTAWMHEGVAEAFAAIALRTTDPAAGPEVDRRIAAARTDCARSTATRSLAAAIAAGDFGAAYSCGMLIALAVNDGAVARRPGGDGLFAVWRRFAADADEGAELPLSRWTKAIEQEAGGCVAQALAAAPDRVGGAIDADIRRCRISPSPAPPPANPA